MQYVALCSVCCPYAISASISDSLERNVHVGNVKLFRTLFGASGTRSIFTILQLARKWKLEKRRLTRFCCVLCHSWTCSTCTCWWLFSVDLARRIHGRNLSTRLKSLSISICISGLISHRPDPSITPSRRIINVYWN